MTSLLNLFPLALAAAAGAVSVGSLSPAPTDAASAGSISLTFDPSTPPLFRTLPTYLSVNLDTGSLYNNFSFSNPTFQQLVRNLALLSPTQFRIGGGAADATIFTGEGGASGSCPGLYPGIDICVNAQDWDDIMAFSAATGVGIVWDLNAAIFRASASGAWNSSNAQQLFQHASLAASKGLPVPIAVQLGNEPEDWYKRHPPLNVSGYTLGQDYHTLRALLASYPALSGSKIMGPDACCEDRYPLIHDFTGNATGSLDAVTVHAYPLPRFPNSSCCCWPPYYTNKSAMLGVATAIRQYQTLAAPILALGVPLVLGETATSAHGGCDGLSNRFIAGFTFMLELGTLGELGVSQVNRQDIAGFSSETGPSSYALLGPPGWDGPGMITPHPDYWVAILWKQLVGQSVLASSSAVAATSTWNSEPPLDSSTLDIHVWCAASSGSNVVVTWFNMGSEPVTLTLPPGLPTAPRMEYTLSSPDGNLTSDQVLLNGAWLVTRADGTIPEFPLPGNEVGKGGGEPSLEPLSFGFFVFTGFSAPACVSG